MRIKLFPWLGREFVALSCEGAGTGSVVEETADIFNRFKEALAESGCTLDETVRTRLWARDMECWDGGVHERARILSGNARSVSSSHIRPARFAGQGRIAIDLLAMRSPPDGEKKSLQEYDPQTIVLRRLNWGGIAFLSGVTVILPTFEDQFPVIIQRITDTLREAGSSWNSVARASFFLHRSQSMDMLRRRFRDLVDAPIPHMDYTFVDTRQGKLIEIEITARTGQTS